MNEISRIDYAAEDAAKGDHDGAGGEHAEDEVLHAQADGGAAAAVRRDGAGGAGPRVVQQAGAGDGPGGGEEADEVRVACGRRRGGRAVAGRGAGLGGGRAGGGKGIGRRGKGRRWGGERGDCGWWAFARARMAWCRQRPPHRRCVGLELS